MHLTKGEFILSHFIPNIADIDVMIGYRADDSYFSFAEDFVNNTISLRDLSLAMQLGTLGEQVVLLSKRFFKRIQFVEYEVADYREYYYKRTDFLKRFIQSDVAEQIESGNPKYIAGKSSLELFGEVMEKTTGETYSTELVKSYDRSNVYWVGWMLTHYQRYSGRTFKSILDTVPYDELIVPYGMLHEADIQKSYEVLDSHFF